MREILGRLGDVFYWAGCVGLIWAVGYVLQDALTRSRWNDYGDIIGLGGIGWVTGWVFRYILSGYRGIKPIRPQETEPAE